MNVASQMSSAALALLEGFDDAQRSRAQLPFPSDDERRLWFYTPTNHGGLALTRMAPVQHQSCMRLLAAGLSEPGYVTASAIIALENILDRIEGWPGGGDRRVRDPLAYSVTIFGDPGDDRWGWRFGGHHISLNTTIVDGRVAFTPCFFGADPARSPLADGTSLRPLGAVEDPARRLVHSLDDRQREVAILSPVPPLDIVMGNRSRVTDRALPMGLWEIFRGPPPVPEDQLRAVESSIAEHMGLRAEHLEALRYTAEPKGLAAASMTSHQRDSLVDLVAQYLRRAPAEVAGPKETGLRGTLADVHFAWAGGIEEGEAHYYRVQGPGLLIEYDNVQRSANHAHSVLRDPEGDFGDDLLSAHYAEHHAQG